jgi:hypothetical protein
VNQVTVLVQTAKGGLLIASSSSANPHVNIQVLLTVFGLLLAGICVCRMNTLSPARHKLGTRLKYLLMFGGSLALAGDPWFFPRHEGLGTLLFLVTVTVGVLLSSPDWRRGPPAYHNKCATQQELFDASISRQLGSLASGVRRLFRRAGQLVARTVRGDR